MKRLKLLTLLILASSFVYAEEVEITNELIVQGNLDTSKVVDCAVSDCYPDSYECCRPWSVGISNWLPCEEYLATGFIELLYWNPREEGLDYAFNQISPATSPPGETSITIITANPGSYRPGFRIGTDFTLPCSKVDFATQWTWFYSGIHKAAPTSQFTTGSNAQVPTYIEPGIFPAVFAPDSSTANWALRFNTLDTELGYSLCFEGAQNFLIRPKFGVRAAWIHQGLTVQYPGLIEAIAGGGTLSGALTSVNKNNFWGVGFHVGADLGWNLFDCWTLFCRSGASLLSGKFNVTQRNFYTPSGTTTQTMTKSDLFVESNVVSAIDLAAGISWATDFWCLCPLELSLGWECQMWFSQNQLHQILANGDQSTRYSTMRGNLSLQGIIARASMTF